MAIQDNGKGNVIHLRSAGLKGNEDTFNVTIDGDNNTIEGEDGIGGTGKINIIVRASNCKISLGPDIIVNRALNITIVPAGGGMPSKNCHVSIGARCMFNGISRLSLAESNNGITIGEDCLFADGITFSTSDSHPVFDLDDSRRLNPSASIFVGDNVWVGNGAHFLKKATILSNSVVGAHSVVTRKFEVPNIAVAGNPATIIRENITWKRVCE